MQSTIAASATQGGAGAPAGAGRFSSSAWARVTARLVAAFATAGDIGHCVPQGPKRRRCLLANLEKVLRQPPWLESVGAGVVGTAGKAECVTCTLPMATPQAH